MDNDLSSTASREGLLVGACSVVSALCYIAVILRFLCRTRTGTGLWWDDWLIAITLIPQLSMYILTMTIIKHFVGHHIGAVDLSKMGEFGKAFFWCQLGYPIILTTVKCSVLALYWRIFSKAARWPLIAMGIFVLIWGVTLLLVIIFQCNPIEGAWDLLAPDRHCMDFKKLLIGGPPTHILQDTILMIMPLPYIFRLHMPLRQRILISLIFMLGGFIVVVSILRLILIAKIDFNDLDMTWTFTDVTIWTSVEINITIVCACLPCLRPIITLIKTGSFVADGSSTSASSQQGLKSSGAQSTGKRSWGFNKWSAFSHSSGQDTLVETSRGGQLPTTTSMIENEKGIVVTKKWDVETQELA